MGYDQDTFNKIGVLQAKAIKAEGAFEVAEAIVEALNTRVATFEAALEAAKASLSTAKNNLSAAQHAQGTIEGAMKAAVNSARQAVRIYAYVKQVFQLSYTAAQQAMVAAYSVSEVLDRITTAEAKNSFISRQLLTAAQNADTSAATAVTAAATTFESATTAFAAAKRSVWAAFLVMAGVMNLQRLVVGYRQPSDTNAPEVPDALLAVPQPQLDPIPLPSSATLEQQLDSLMDQWIQDFTGNVSSPLLTPVATELNQLLPPNSPPQNFEDTLQQNLIPGLLQWMDKLLTQAIDSEDVMDGATTQAKVALTRAQQDLARKASARDATNKALIAAKQAA